MAFSSCFCYYPVSHKLQRNQAAPFAVRPKNFVLSSQQFGWSFLGGSRVIILPNLPKTLLQRRSSRVSASWLASSEVANGVFPLGLVAVLPFYLSMVVAPKAKLTQKVMESNMPYIVLGILYSYLFYLSWTPDKLQLLFPANTSWIPELAGIAKMFSREMTLASVWIHLLTIDLFAARKQNLDITSIASNGGRVQCMQVWPPINMKKYETLSYLPDLSEEQLLKEVEYLLKNGWVPCLEFETEHGFVYREHNNSPGYYDGRYWTMWKLPMFGCTDATQVLAEVEEAKKAYPQAWIRIIGFDNVRQVQCISFIAYKPEGY